MVTNHHYHNTSTNNNTTTTTTTASSSNPFKRLFRHSKDHMSNTSHHHNEKSLHHHMKEDEHKTTCSVASVLVPQEEDLSIPSSSLVISSFTMLNNKRRFSSTTNTINHHQLQDNEKTNSNETKEKRRYKKQKNFFQFFKSNNTSNDNNTSNQLQSENTTLDIKHRSIDLNSLDFDFAIVDQPVTSNTSYMTNCTTTSSVDYHSSNRAFLTNVNNTTCETPLDRIIFLNEATKLARPISKKISQEKGQLHRGKQLKITSNEHIIFGQPLRSKLSVSNGDKRRRVGDENNESMILSEGYSPSNSFTIMTDEVVKSPKLDQSSSSIVEEFL